MLLAVEVGTITAVAALIAATGGIITGVYSVRQTNISTRRAAQAAADAERDKAVVASRTVDREDFDSVVDGLRGVVAERTAQYNDLLATHRDVVASCRQERDEFLARIHSLEAELGQLRRRGGRPTHER